LNNRFKSNDNEGAHLILYQILILTS